ncbi:murein biosynthesis integral membrane protein MurJ [Bifidobacterium myosotis]|uniref:Murein biosynthesis integral membrane protein MurJ n=1 Tax=Bifidobacterium myosotis TaxID=1630166 RepID=A0A5M9ZH05_9BIFI|nr:murein biosynthesis integral membrane protein MurJ [Bifidobacterium myosotis]KAA8826019.1 murein biosynthesis integral membrane protein MurJ [Bifidobacterium myosotis]
MSSTVGRNSLIMATGTAASRVTGQLRTILLAAAIGTTGLAANAYQAGSMIPQSVFTLVSGGIFNAVLVPQIVRTMKEKDAQERLNRLITLAIGLLLVMTLIMAAAAPLLTLLYVGGDDHQMIALTTAFTLWCMPQVFFYGLYTVLGQILAARDHFVTYAWSSTGANVISCAGFAAFIMLFGKANEQPLDFWTADKIALTAGTWTLGVAFQALILFLPLARIGFKYRPSFGLTGFGLKAMGPVALGSLGVVITSEISGIVLTRAATLAPQYAHDLTGASLFSVAGNATYQNAYTLFVLPYSLIAVSVSTAMFPKISRSVAARDLDEARRDLGGALNNVGLLLMFFAAAMIVFPEPIIRALLPSVSMDETMLIAYALTTLSVGIPPCSAFLLIQRTFYAFEDGLHPFLSALLQYGLVSAFIIGGVMVLPPEHWVTWIACSVTIGAFLALPPTLIMLRRRFDGHLGGRGIIITYAKAVAAAVVAGLVTWLLKGPVTDLFGVSIRHTGGHMGWFAALGICVVLTIVLAVVYVGMLWILRTPELTGAVQAVTARLGRGKRTASSSGTIPKASPADRISTSIPNISNNHTEPDEPMKPQLGDTILNRYTLVSSLREEPGIAAWKANDRVLAKDCQLFIVSNSQVLTTVDDIAGRIVATKPAHHVPVLKYRMQAGVLLAVMPLDRGLSVSEYLAGAGNVLSHDAMRSIIGETMQAIRPMLAGSPVNEAITTDTVRLTASGVEIADAPFTPLLADTLGLGVAQQQSRQPEGPEQVAIRQLAALLYALLTHSPSQAEPHFDLSQLPMDTPGEFRVILKRGLNLIEADDPTLPMASLAELEALLGDWKPLSDMGSNSSTDIALPNVDGECSIATAPLQPVAESDVNPIPAGLVSSQQLPTLSINTSAPNIAMPAVPLPDDTGKNGTANGTQKDERRLFDFNNLSNAWQDENLSGEDTGDWYSTFNPAPTSAAVGNSRLTVPIPTGNLAEPAPGETTSRIPIFDAAGREVAPGEESLRALEEEQARIAEIAAIPPSFEPKNPPKKTVDSELPNEHLFGNFTTKVVAIVVAVLVVAAATVWAVIAFRDSSSNPADVSTGKSAAAGQWPEFDESQVPFGSGTGSSASGDDESDSSSQSSSSDSSQSTNGSSSSDSQSKKSEKVTTADKDSKAVPTPKHVNNTPYTISSANFLTNPGGQSGYAYYLHLDQPHDVYRMTVTIRTSGGKGYIRANTTGDPTQGEQVAEFTFAEGGTTEIKFTKTVNAQDLILWVPTDSMPQNQLYIQKVEVF